MLVIVQLLLLSLRNALRRRIAARETRKAARREREPVPEAAGWEQDLTDDAWSEDDDWTESDGSTAEDDSAAAAADFVPADIVRSDRPSPSPDVATGPQNVGVGGAPAPADGSTAPTETHWPAPSVDRPNGAASESGDRSANPIPRGRSRDKPTGVASRRDSSK